MKIDVSVIITSDKVSVSSAIANYSEERLPLMAFSKEVGKSIEICEAVGENWTAEEMEAFAIKSGVYQKCSRTFRVINPFIPQRFEPYAATLMLEFFCTKTFFEIKPARGHWRKIFGFDFFELKLKIENYVLVSLDKREEFEKLLSKKMRKLQIE